MNAQHTPGPLYVKMDENWPFNINTFNAVGDLVFVEKLPCHSTRDESPQEALDCVNFVHENREEYSEANHRALADAILRAAAPDLLAMIQELREYIHVMKGAGHEWPIRMDALIAKATAA